MKRLQFLFALLVGKIIMGLTKIIPGVSGTTWPGGIANILMKRFPKSTCRSNGTPYGGR